MFIGQSTASNLPGRTIIAALARFADACICRAEALPRCQLSSRDLRRPVAPPDALTIVYVQSNIAGSCITARPGVTYSALFPPWLEVGRLRATGLFRATDHDCGC